MAVQYITSNITGRVVLFIDNKSVIQTLSRLHPHNGQHEALRINDMIYVWLNAAIINRIEIVWVPSHSGFALNEHADRSMKSPFIGPVPPKAPSLSSAIRANKTQAVLSWRLQFAVFQSRKRLLLRKNKKPVLPSTWNAASNRFIMTMNDNPTLVSRFTRAVTNHAPIGEYRTRFFPQQPSSCPCGALLQSREHILCECPRYSAHFPSSHSFYKGRHNLNKLAKFLQDNPIAFAFDDAPPELDDPP